MNENLNEKNLDNVISQSFDIMKTTFVNYYVVFISIGLISFIINTILNATGLLSILTILVSNLTSILTILVLLKLINNEYVGTDFFKDYFSKAKEDFSKFMNDFFIFFATNLLTTLIIIGGTLLLIIPGIFWGYKYRFAPILSVEEKLNPMESLRKSAELTNGYKLSMLWLDLILLGINILGLLCFGIGLFLTLPLTALASIVIYRRLNPVLIESTNYIEDSSSEDNSDNYEDAIFDYEESEKEDSINSDIDEEENNNKNNETEEEDDLYY